MTVIAANHKEIFTAMVLKYTLLNIIAAKTAAAINHAFKKETTFFLSLHQMLF